MGAHIVELINVTKKIGNKTIIDGLTLNIQKGEIFGLLGPNGAGKTTTVRMLVGLLSITSGEILINGKSISKEFTEAIANVGAIVENPEFYTHLSGYQNLVIFSNMVPNIPNNRIEEVINLVGLQNRIEDRVKTYSLGMRQRLGLAQALLNQPSVLILDEPTNGLDPTGIKELREYLRDLAFNKGVTIIVSSHVLSEMELMCNRIAIIQKGKLVDLQIVGDGIPKNQTSTVYFEVSDAIQAQAHLHKVFPDLDINFQDSFLEILTTKENIAEINSILVKQGIKVYGIRTKIKTLEDKYMEITGSEDIV